jgi:chemotaxis protein MotB
MARKHKHEDHANHEAWAIPYGDLVTLLLAFFVVMYAISSVNEGKFRVLSDSLQAAFRGQPKTLEPIQVGEKQRGSGADIAVSIVQQATIEGQPRQMLEAVSIHTDDGKGQGPSRRNGVGRGKGEYPIPPELRRVAEEVEKSLALLVDANLVAIRRHAFWIEVEIRTDILFASGSATLAKGSLPALEALSTTLKPYSNPIRVEGHTDDRPISTREFPSNWELSAARAASVVHKFAKGGIEPARLSVIGLGEFRPAQPNTTAEGRNHNRRVLIVILSGKEDANGMPIDPSGSGVAPSHDLATPGEEAAPVGTESTPPAGDGAPAPVAVPEAATASNSPESAAPNAAPTSSAPASAAPKPGSPPTNVSAVTPAGVSLPPATR